MTTGDDAQRLANGGNDGGTSAVHGGAILTKLIDITYRTGLLEAAALGPATSHALAERPRLSVRYVRDWLGAMVTSGVTVHDSKSDRAAFSTSNGGLP